MSHLPAHLDNLPCSIKEFFTPEEYLKIPQYERIHLTNMRQNFEALRKYGLPVQPPEFMVRLKSQRQKLALMVPVDDFSSEGSDSEWTPAAEMPKLPTKRKSKPFFPLRPMFSEPSAQKKKKQTSSVPKKKRRPSVPPMDQSEDDSSSESHVYPLRKKRMTCYMALAIPDDDDFLYCEECNFEYDGDCPEHGPLLIVADAQVPEGINKGTHSQYSSKTLPEGLIIKRSTIPGAGLGVFAVKDFPSRTRFGPYGGKKVKDEATAHLSGYCWQVTEVHLLLLHDINVSYIFSQIFEDEKPSHFVDASDPACSNWMRFVNCARSEEEQCVTAYQYKGEIYYRSHRPIPAGTEILVYYGDSYARDLGIQVQKVGRLVRAQTEPKEFIRGPLGEADGVFSCRYCPLAFSHRDMRENHTRKRHRHLTHFRFEIEQNVHLRKMNELREATSGDTCAGGKDNSFYHNETDDKQMCLERPRCGSDVDSGKCDSVVEQKGIVCVETSNACKIIFSKAQEMPEGENCHQNPTARSGVGCENGQLEKCSSKVKTSCTLPIVGSFNCLEPARTGSEEQAYSGEVEVRHPQVTSPMDLEKRLKGDRSYRCEVCGAGFTQSRDLQKHKRTHTGEKPYSCEVCGAGFTQYGNLQSHKRTHTGEKPYKCEVCGARFAQYGNLQSHKRTHTGEKPYKCEVCGAGFARSGDLQSHKRTHTGEKPYKCEVCGAGFAHSGHLQSHKRTHTGERPYKCEVCGAGFAHSGHLQRHKRTHTGEKPYKCEVCGAGFTQYGNLQSHKRTHTGEKPYKCEVCGAGFTQYGNLQSHKRTHTGEKPYKCEVCGAGFAHSGHLQSHKRTHTGERPYKCEVCGAGFAHSGHLQRHKRTHTGEKPYKCEVCGAGFTQYGNLQSHKRTHTGEKPYKCEVCGARFAWSNLLKRHKCTHRAKALMIKA
ncbi:histone-lysine N-methyltransferase PRDM9 [Aplysia californica]|uniref:Histone-lysine N-methyltransferase PRDM9 n=1 Tax=Aplysia californica TaxID=6500 RepID=A0ABM1VY40_APLCA|nr:histone-lysine N-methyltransferase PRDM9 [Aplysia californica]